MRLERLDKEKVGMGLLKCVSLLVCALCLAIPSCFGAVWTAEDEARALRQGKGRLSHTADGGQLQSQGDESLERLQPQFDGREQFDGARAPHQGRGNLNLNNRSPYATNVDQSASPNTRFGSQFQSATNTKFQSETNARFGGRTQDDSTKLDAPAFPTFGFGGKPRGLGSEHPSQGFGEGFPASKFESQTRHEVEFSQTEHVFDGRTPQAATQLDSDNFGLDSKNFGFQPLHNFGFQPLPSFGFQPLPQKSEAELAFEAEQARLRAAQEAHEASLRESQEAFEDEIKRLKQRGCSSCHLVLQVAAFEEENTELLDDLPVKVSKLLDVDESEPTVKLTISRDGCVTCHLVNPPSPEPAPIVEGAHKAGHFKVPILVDEAGRAAPLQNSVSSAVLDLRKASSFRTSILMDSEDRPFIPAAPQRASLVYERSFNDAPQRAPSFNDAPQRRLKATQARPRERGCRSCHVVHG